MALSTFKQVQASIIILFLEMTTYAKVGLVLAFLFVICQTCTGLTELTQNELEQLQEIVTLEELEEVERTLDERETETVELNVEEAIREGIEEERKFKKKQRNFKMNGKIEHMYLRVVSITSAVDKI